MTERVEVDDGRGEVVLTYAALSIVVLVLLMIVGFVWWKCLVLC